jgi:Mlc titration factor MtfA (ptsG expression regulator)
MFGFKRRRRERLRRKPLPAEWWRIIDRNVPYVRSLRPALRTQLAGIIQIILHEKTFEGAGGLVMTDEIRLTIAAQAAVLLLNRETRYYPTLKSIIVYPSAYFANSTGRNPDGSVSDGPQHRLGESWFRGALVLSWDAVLRGAADAHDGHNVVLHEFAHQLDGESGAMEGAPMLLTSAHYRMWSQVLSAEYNQLMCKVHNGFQSALDPYGATSPPEFFAVATEAFFERPAELKRESPALYQQLAEFYAQDPSSR